MLDLKPLKPHVEAAIEALLRAADARVSWKQPSVNGDEGDPTTEIPRVPYAFLPGVYKSATPSSESTTHNSSSEAMLPSQTMEAESEHGAIQLLLHGDNTFEYTWTMKRRAPRAMEYTVEMRGQWSKPVLNRSRRGDEDQRVFLTTSRIRFQRLSNFDSENQIWKLSLRTLTRHDSDWAPVGESERGIPPIVIVFECSDGLLTSTGAVACAQVLTNSPSCRVLAGLTKKIANKLGGPLDVMTEKWLPPRGVQLRVSVDGQLAVKLFNPFYWYDNVIVMIWNQWESNCVVHDPY
ncbi:hypothetical protein Poli38472_008548 [Pythium oligandrum]|uniref:Uncharacterized protein n=1 Tax=Pythium oligandrum TaxID=41045 RepID=A0A8K1C3R6_PYTOL|nr:hypothetical protein Poli38472_008548 [Pythium oligandrum]|eukprot:TMW55900.1 hypothetical protein Poli38472_008548 [Pythium oligandrum]